MARLEALKPNLKVNGIIPNQPVIVVSVNYKLSPLLERSTPPE